MGINCSTIHDSDSNAEKDSETHTPSEPARMPNHHHSSKTMNVDQYSLLDGYEGAIDKRLGTSSSRPNLNYSNPEEYYAQRGLIQQRQAALAFDFVCASKASSLELEADKILQAAKRRDNELVYAAAEARTGYGGQTHPRFFGDHFLSNVDLIEDTYLFKIARRMPKGSHLHIHFNANLVPDVLVSIAKRMPHMYIMSNIPLVTKDGDSTGFDSCKISFSILSNKKFMEHKNKYRKPQSLFNEAYIPKEPMPFSEFCDQFQEFYNWSHDLGRGDKTMDVDKWLHNKLVFQEEETYNLLQTADGAWDKFNGRTQMMKGLFNYETAYKEYTWRCLGEFVDDKIQYAEIRPNFMSTNQVWKDDGESQLNNWGIMELIIDVYDKFQKKHKRSVLKGLKVIYCTPRSFNREMVGDALKECLEFKLKWPKWIAGFDLVGEESKGFPLKKFVPEFLSFKDKCAEKGVDIPFLFHCGETLSIGGETDGNLFDALLLGSRRIGHGFALPRHPYVMEKMKAANICVELCPISNEILGLTPRMNGHAAYSLLANNVHCTVSTDNGTLFRSRLSHDFYQMMAGKPDMTLHGWRQLIEWSIEHSSMESNERNELRESWLVMWKTFCREIIDTYKNDLEAYLNPGNDNPGKDNPGNDNPGNDKDKNKRKRP